MSGIFVTISREGKLLILKTIRGYLRNIPRTKKSNPSCLIVG